MRSGRVERAAGPCAFGSDGAAEEVDLGSTGAAKRADIDENIPAVSRVAEEALLGQPLLGERLLRGHRWARCGHDTQVCPLSGKAGATDGATPIGELTIMLRHNSLARPLGGRAEPPYGGSL